MIHDKVIVSTPIPPFLLQKATNFNKIYSENERTWKATDYDNPAEVKHSTNMT